MPSTPRLHTTGEVSRSSSQAPRPTTSQLLLGRPTTKRRTRGTRRPSISHGSWWALTCLPRFGRSIRALGQAYARRSQVSWRFCSPSRERFVAENAPIATCSLIALISSSGRHRQAAHRTAPRGFPRRFRIGFPVRFVGRKVGQQWWSRWRGRPASLCYSSAWDEGPNPSVEGPPDHVRGGGGKITYVVVFLAWFSRPCTSLNIAQLGERAGGLEEVWVEHAATPPPPKPVSWRRRSLLMARRSTGTGTETIPGPGQATSSSASSASSESDA